MQKCSFFDIISKDSKTVVYKVKKNRLNTYLNFFRYAQLKTIEDERRAYEAKMKPIWDAEKAAAKEAANRESMLSLAAAAGVKVKFSLTENASKI